MSFDISCSLDYHVLLISVCGAIVSDCLIADRMAAAAVGMAFIPYYNHIMNILETSDDLKKTFRG